MARSKVTLKFNQSGFQEIRTAPKVMDMIDDIADQTAQRAGDGFEARKATKTGGRVRGRAAVVTTTRDAAERESRDHTMVKALGSPSDG